MDIVGVLFAADSTPQQGTVDDDDGAVPSGADWPIKAVGTAAQKGSKRRAKRVMNVIGRAVGSALIPVRFSTDLNPCRPSSHVL